MPGDGAKSACAMAAQRIKILSTIKNKCNFLIIHNPPLRFYEITHIDITNINLHDLTSFINQIVFQ